MTKADKPKDLGLEDNLSFPAPTARISTSTHQPPPPPAKKTKKPKRNLPSLHLDLENLPSIPPVPLPQISYFLIIIPCLILVAIITYQKLIGPRYPRGSLSLTCDRPFSFIPRHYQFTSQADCQALRCTYNGVAKEGDLYWCSQGTQENPVTCPNRQNNKYTCSAPVGKCEVLRLSTDNNCDSAVTYDCSGCPTTRPNLLSPTFWNPLSQISPPTAPPLLKVSFAFPKSLDELFQSIGQAFSFIRIGFSAIQNNQ